MAVGLELRAPFMNQDLVDFALNLSDSHKLGNRSKFLLIEAFKDMLLNPFIIDLNKDLHCPGKFGCAMI
jgi:hypothetical protein